MALPALIPAAGGLIAKGTVAAKAAMVAKGAAIGAAGVAAGAAAAKTASSAAKAASGAASKTSKVRNGSGFFKIKQPRLTTKSFDRPGISAKSSVAAHSPHEAEFFGYSTDDGKYRARWGSRVDREAFEGYKKAAEEKYRSAQASDSVFDSAKRGSRKAWTKFKGWFGKNSPKLIFPLTALSGSSIKTKRGGVSFGGYNSVSSKEHGTFVAPKVNVDARSFRKNENSKRKSNRNANTNRSATYSSSAKKHSGSSSERSSSKNKKNVAYKRRSW